jgi:alpha-galactosidase
VEEQVGLMLQAHKVLIAQQQVELETPESLAMLEQVALAEQLLAMVTQVLLTVEEEAEVNLVELQQLAEQALQATPLFTNHPLFFYFA